MTLYQELLSSLELYLFDWEGKYIVSPSVVANSEIPHPMFLESISSLDVSSI